MEVADTHFIGKFLQPNYKFPNIQNTAEFSFHGRECSFNKMSFSAYAINETKSKPNSPSLEESLGKSEST